VRSVCIGISAVCLLALCSGCVHVHQLVKMNHDGSGTLTETVKVLPRAVRLLKGYKTRKGESIEKFSILTEDALNRRVKALGGVTVKTKGKEETLPDGALQIRTVYGFKDVNKVNLCMAPTFKCTSPERKGSLKFRYSRIVRSHNRPYRYYKKDQLNVSFSRCPTQTKYSSPSVQQEYRDVTPIFQDMLKDFRFEVQIQAPDDIETFVDKRTMIRQLHFEDDIVTPYRVYGENVAGNTELIKGFLVGEVGGRSDAYGGDWRRTERAMPNTYTPYGSGYGGVSVHFFKPVEVPAPDAGKKKEGDKKGGEEK
jgi:hypothetical protein